MQRRSDQPGECLIYRAGIYQRKAVARANLHNWHIPISDCAELVTNKSAAEKFAVDSVD